MVMSGRGVFSIANERKIPLYILTVNSWDADARMPMTLHDTAIRTRSHFHFNVTLHRAYSRQSDYNMAYSANYCSSI